MTIPIRAVKYRLRRTTGSAEAALPDAPQADTLPAGAPGADPVPGGAGAGDAGNGPAPDDAASPAQRRRAWRLRRALRTVPDTAAPQPVPPATDAPAPGGPVPEGAPLTTRQLRMARHIAQHHGIEVDTDEQAVTELRRRGIDPFRPNSAVELLSPHPATPADRVQLPQTVRAPAPPAPRPLDEGERVDHIMRIQRDILRRRRRNLAMLAARLLVFVLLPTLAVGWYYFRMATPFYATRSEFLIQQAENPAMAGMGGLLRGTQFATSQDSITVQSYLQSREAMLRLDGDLGYRVHFSDPAIDPVQRLAADATNEAAYRLYQRNVKIGYDPTEGILKMEVIAPDPALSQAFSEALIGYAEEQVDSLSLRLREDQMKGARDSYDDAETKVREAQQAVLELQQKVGVLDPLTENSVVMAQISTFEIELRKKNLELQQLLDNRQPNAARVDGARGDIARLETMIADLRAGLTEDKNGNASLAVITGQLRIAEGELESRQLMLAQALQQMETARIEANRQTRYLETGVRPVAPDEATYPRAFENTLLALLLFSGIYLMLSLTAAILREQVSS